MRLIDADELIINLYHNKKVVLNDDLVKCIDDTETTYSVDKVVEELNELPIKAIDRYKGGVFGNWEGTDYYINKTNAIEIVKQGGVADDVCEWKYTKEIMDNAEFKVGCNQNALKRGVVPNNFSYHDFKYCPYCGKKIKVV